MKNLLASISLILTSIAAFAHEGHGHENSLSPKHYLANPEHAIPIALIVALAVLTIWYLARRSKTTRH